MITSKKQLKRILQTERAIKAERDLIQQNLNFVGDENCRKNHQKEQE